MRCSRTRSRLSVVALIVCATTTCGCAYLQVPRIDPTGERIFATPPIAATPPVAATPRYRQEPAGQLPSDDVGVTLSPSVAVAPVGSEVVLLAGVLGPDGYLRTNRRLEWSLAPGGSGHFVAVGRGGLVDLLLGDFNRPRKVDNTFAIGSTSRNYLQLNRGTSTTTDDVCVLRGQGWITLTSQIEGTSHVTVYAPEVYAWDCRTRSAVIHWVDAQWRFPPPAINPAGTRHVFTTTVMRQSDQSPCAGWRVRYEIVDGPPAGFTPDGAAAVEVETDTAGQANAEIFQKEPGPGTNKISVQVIRPAGLAGSQGKRLVVGSGTTMKTWTAAALAVRKTAPATAAVGTTLNYRIEVSNPGDLPAEDVLVTDQLPEVLEYLDSNPPAELTGRKLQWRLGQLSAGQNRVIELNCRATALGPATNCADATAAGPLKASDCATTTVMAATIDIQVTGPQQATVGSQVAFQILITNRGQVPATGLLIKDRFGEGLEHAEAASPIERDLGTLAPGESQRVDVTFRATRAGRLCHTVEVIGADGVRATAQGCVMVVGAAPAEPQLQPPLETARRPTVSIRKTGPPSASVGGTAQFTIDITNTGSQPLSSLKVVDQYDAVLSPTMATDGYKFEDNNLVWTLDSLPAGKTTQLEVHFRCQSAAARACNRVSVTTQEGARVEAEACLEIRAAAGGLNIEVGDSRDPVRLGKGLTYEIRVSNDGNISYKQVTVVATVPAGMMSDRIGTSGPRYTIDGQTVRFDAVPEIRPGEKRSYRIRVRTQQPGKLIFRAELTSQDLPQPVVVEETTDVLQ